MGASAHRGRTSHRIQWEYELGYSGIWSPYSARCYRGALQDRPAGMSGDCVFCLMDATKVQEFEFPVANYGELTAPSGHVISSHILFSFSQVRISLKLQELVASPTSARPTLLRQSSSKESFEYERTVLQRAREVRW